jgi:molybdenum-dependent DNA-binding transcriptional regulator ModE
MRFGKLIEDACKKQGVSYKELARALRRTQPWALHVVRSENLTERVFKECAWALDMDVEVKLVKRRRRGNGKQGSSAGRAARKARARTKKSNGAA